MNADKSDLIKVYEDPATGRRTAVLPSVYHLSAEDARICEMAEGWFSPEMIAARCRCTIQHVTSVLESVEGEGYRDYLVLQRELDNEGNRAAMRELRNKSVLRLDRILSNSDDKVALSAIKEILDRDPDKEFVKTSREEKVYSGSVRIDTDTQTRRLGAINTKYKVLSA